MFRSSLKFGASTLPVLALLTLAPQARAQHPDAETIRAELLAEAAEHSENARFQLAYDATIAALSIRIERETLCNAGLIASSLERYPEASEILAECLRLTTDPPKDQQEIESRLVHATTFAMVRTHVGTLRIQAPALARISVDHRMIGLAPIDRDVFVTANKGIEIHAHNFNGEGTEYVIVAPGQSKTVVVSTRPVERKSPALAPLLSSAAPALAPPLAEPRSFFGTNTAFKISFISTLAAAGCALTFTAFSVKDFDDARAHLDIVKRRYLTGCASRVEPECTLHAQEYDSARNFRNLAIGTGIAAGVGAVLTIFLHKSTPIKTTAQGLSIAF